MTHGMSAAILIQTLTESFAALADEVQSLIDRKTILEHKLRYAHEQQFQYLADKYAVPDVSETLAKLQIPPDLHLLATATSAVPLPKRGLDGNNQHQIALLIREGRKAAKQLAIAMTDAVQFARSGQDTPLSLGMEGLTAASTVLEKDFTVHGRKGSLACPFSTKLNQNGIPHGHHAEQVDGSQDLAGGAGADPTPHKSTDPICAAMLEDAVPSPTAAATASKCPIRFLDKHSPEEIAHYVETHKHEIPRSHEVCVRRYQRNEEQIRKLDAKYGNLVSMVEDLSHLHRPMLPPAAGNDKTRVGSTSSNKRVEDWAQTIVAADPDIQDNEMPPTPHDEEGDRENRFDRNFREVRVGESPTRPWGIPVPIQAGLRPQDIPPVRSSSPVPPMRTEAPAVAPEVKAEPKKCPFDHTKMGFKTQMKPHPPTADPNLNAGHNLNTFYLPLKYHQELPSSPPQPPFVNLPESVKPAAPTSGDKGADRPPQIVYNFNGPVFIGYPMEQAMQLMQQWQQQKQ
ncbi:uncharacterized protein PODANS_1_10400 [Podospora anserina S mat+]|uniref:Podospora anserina S mat+ genomic DNA chromosome 1, supercontig 2 n=1 Tax=Podospora anserina (strain S / ATCC MYA-4624 / DSM 980 / FGSC 10383) TaxID=515849 RepID=B2AYA2_PODAN|nr:uncharacterized protein PODANS_1_10400 [Podospora anserina S mat+]CAP69376.1 unnamed protein product [Podospora anserina S mat+]CDP23397.1 Putative protein of unknown function [Podospora anserina S mat+]